MSILNDSEKLMLLTGKTIGSISSFLFEDSVIGPSVPGVTFSYVNYTGLTLKVVERSGLTVVVPPQEAAERRFQGYFLVEEKHRAFGIDMVAPNDCIYEAAKGTVNVTGPYIELVKHSKRDNVSRHSIIHSVMEDALIKNNDGIYIPLAGITVGKASSNLKNKFLDTYIADNEIGSSTSTAIKLISSNKSLKLYVVTGDRVETITGIDKGYDEDYVEVYHSNSKDVMELVSKLSVPEALKHGVVGLPIFTTEIAAQSFADAAPKAMSENAGLKTKVRQLERQVEEDKLKHAAALRKTEEALAAEKDSHRSTRSKSEADKSKNRTASWTKVAAIATALASLVSSIWSIVIRLRA